MTFDSPSGVAQFSLKDVQGFVDAAGSLSKTRRRDLQSAIARVAALLHRNPGDIPASASYLRVQLDKLHPIQSGMSPKRLANIKADLKAALALLPSTPSANKRMPLTQEWQLFRKELGKGWEPIQLARLMGYCSSQGVAPGQVTDVVIQNFRTCLSTTLVTKDPENVVKRSIQTWNGLAERKNMNLPRLTPPPRNDFVTRPLTDYPQSFQDDINNYLDRLSQPWTFELDGPPKPLKPITVRNISASIRQYAHHAVATGLEPDRLTGLAVLVEKEVFKNTFSLLLASNGNKPSPSMSNIATTLFKIAKHHVKVSPEHLQWLKNAKSKLFVEYTGLTQKNKERLAQFLDVPRNVDRLMGLPSHLLKKSKEANRSSSRIALMVMHAVAIELLLICPIRVANLARLNLAEHFLWHGQAQGQRLAIAIPGDEVKNAVPLEFDVPRSSMLLVKQYLKVWRPLICETPNDWLFPTPAGKARDPGHFGKDVSSVIYRHTGLRMNVHLFRHLAGALYLEAHPGEYETVRRLLAHRKAQTTVTYYASLESRAAVRRYDEAVLSRRGRSR